MTVASSEQYNAMLDAAKTGKFAYPAINVTSSIALNAALRGFAEAESDGIIQVSTGGAEFFSGATIKNMVAGATAMAAYANAVAPAYPATVALHTDHCPKDKLDSYVRPLLRESARRVANGQEPVFQSHMWDGSAVPLEENLAIAEELLRLSAAAKVVLEVEIGVVGGEEDGVVGAIDEKLYTTPEDMYRTVEALGTGERGRYLLAATFGNVHGFYKPGNVKLRPEILGQGQAYVADKLGLPGATLPLDLVFHGGSGSEKKDIDAAIQHGAIKMNVDTDTQYAFTRPIADHMFKHYDGVLRIDDEVGDKKAYDPRSYGKAAEESMARRVAEFCELLGSAGRRLQ